MSGAMKTQLPEYNVKRRHIVTDTNHIYIRDYDFSTELLELLEKESVPWGKTTKNQIWDGGKLNMLTAYTLNWWNPENPKWVYVIDDMVQKFLKDIDPDCEIESLNRIHALEFVNDGNMRCHETHQDQYVFDNQWTVLVHVYGTSGDTIFYKNMNIPEIVKTVPFRQGRMLLYPSVYAHKGSMPTDDNKRCIINYLYKLKTKLSNDVKIYK